MADRLLEDLAGHSELLIDHIAVDEMVGPAVYTHTPAAGQHLHKLDGVHVPIAVEGGGADVANLADLAADDLDVSGNAEVVVVGNGEAVQVGEGLVVGDRVDPAFVVFPVTDPQSRHRRLIRVVWRGSRELSPATGRPIPPLS